MLKLALLWFRTKMFSRGDRSRLLRKGILVSCGVLSLTCFLSRIILAAYFIDTRPRDSQPAAGSIYPTYLKVSYGATVFLTQNEKVLLELLIPTSIVCFAVGAFLNTRWKILAPYKKSKSDRTIITKRKGPN